MMAATMPCDCGAAVTLKSLRDLWLEGSLCDMIFKFKDETPLLVHKVILVAKSPYFRWLYMENILSDSINMIWCSKETTKMFISYLYGDELKLTRKNVNEVLHIASEYKIDEALGLCLQFIGSGNNISKCTSEQSSTGQEFILPGACDAHQTHLNNPYCRSLVACTDTLGASESSALSPVESEASLFAGKEEIRDPSTSGNVFPMSEYGQYPSSLQQQCDMNSGKSIAGPGPEECNINFNHLEVAQPQAMLFETGNDKQQRRQGNTTNYEKYDAEVNLQGQPMAGSGMKSFLSSSLPPVQEVDIPKKKKVPTATLR